MIKMKRLKDFVKMSVKYCMLIFLQSLQNQTTQNISQIFCLYDTLGLQVCAEQTV